jgi:hypothetical protein
MTGVFVTFRYGDNLDERAVRKAIATFSGHLTARLNRPKETLPVGENYVHLFKQM